MDPLGKYLNFHKVSDGAFEANLSIKNSHISWVLYKFKSDLQELTVYPQPVGLVEPGAVQRFTLNVRRKSFPTWRGSDFTVCFQTADLSLPPADFNGGIEELLVQYNTKMISASVFKCRLVLSSQMENASGDNTNKLTTESKPKKPATAIGDYVVDESISCRTISVLEDHPDNAFHQFNKPAQPTAPIQSFHPSDASRNNCSAASNPPAEHNRYPQNGTREETADPAAAQLPDPAHNQTEAIPQTLELRRRESNWLLTTIYRVLTSFPIALLIGVISGSLAATVDFYYNNEIVCKQEMVRRWGW
jgi:hypothetical protein